MNSIYTQIKNYEILTELFGGWPSFDDFEVVSILLQRSHDGDEAWPIITIQFIGFHQTVGQEDSNRKNYLLTFRFGGVRDVHLEGFNHQNAINGFVFLPKWAELLNRKLFNVNLIQGFGVGAKFECEEIELVSVVPTKR